MPLQYHREKPLFIILLVLSSLLWLALVVGTMGIALLYVLFFFLFYLFAQSAFIAHLKGAAAEVTPDQFPDLHARFLRACEKLGITDRPTLYLQNSDGILNALATRFLGNDYVVLYSGIVDALEDEPDALDFYIGHELGHVRLKHLVWGWVLMPASWLPLLGAAYRRAQEYSCDLHGSACCESEKAAVDAIAVLAVGHTRWKTLDRRIWLHQLPATGGFWMSLHELTGDYPWLTKRMARLLAARAAEAPAVPSRNPFAYFFALFMPRFGGGGGLVSLMVLVAIIGILAAVALPAYQDYLKQVEAARAVSVDPQAMPYDEPLPPAESAADNSYSPEPAAAEIPVAENWLELYEKLIEMDATAEVQEAARQQFFMMHVVPTLEQGADISAAYAEFSNAYAVPAEEAVP